MITNQNSPWRSNKTKLTSYSEEEREKRISMFEKKGYTLLGRYEEDPNYYDEKLRYGSYRRKTFFDSPKRYIAIMKRGN